MSRRLPVVSVTADGTTYTGPQAAVSTATIEIGTGSAIDRARLRIGWLSPLADLEPGSEVAIELGFGDEPATVLTGDVDSVAFDPATLVVDVLARPARLRTVRIGRSYRDLSAGDIVADLAGEAGATTGEIDDGPTLPAYHVDESHHAWWHVQRLAGLSASVVSIAPDGALRFVAAPGGDAGGLGGVAGAAVGAVSALLGGGGGFRFGAELHDWSVATRAALGSAATMAAHGAASEMGSSAWHVLLKEPAGGAPQGRVLLAGAIRDRDAAAGVSGASEDGAHRSRQLGWLTITGDATLRAGDVVDVSEMPVGPNPTLRALRVRHRYGDRAGFVTDVLAEGAAA